MSKSSGTISIENKWNEDLKKIEIIYHDEKNTLNQAFVTYNIPKQKTRNDVFTINYDTSGKSFWKTTIITQSGQTWSSGSFLECNAKKAELAKILISFDVNSKETKINYPKYNSCFKKMTKI
ncbi:hypothetical protein [Providencia vermicola]|uniref:hypothetical protein n=1 Tax=Providencia vermicola TaxID=333965 RepID=UPI001CECE66F|nr:hypothetical protein [Providencia vermicola]